MNHWQMIAFAYSLTFIAMALEVALLLRRRRNAVRQVRGWLDADDVPFARDAHDSKVGTDADRRAGPGAAS